MSLAAFAAPALSNAVSAFLARAPHGLLASGEWQQAAENFNSLDPATGNLLAPRLAG